MRKLAVLMISMVMIFSAVVGAQAASNAYEVKDMGLSISVPDTFDVVTKDTAAEGQIEDANTYLVAASKESDDKISVTMQATDSKDLSELSRKDLSAVASGLYSSYAEEGLTISTNQIYKNDLTTFIRIYFTNADKSVCSLRYYTVLNGNEVMFTLETTAGEITADHEHMFRDVVDSAVADLPAAEDGQNTEATEAAATGATEVTSATEVTGATEAAAQDTEANTSSSMVVPVVIICCVLAAVVVAVVVIKKKGRK